MLYRIANAVAHPNHTVTVTWSDGVSADVDLSPVIAKGNVFAPMADATYFVTKMRIAMDRLGLEWPNYVDFSADGLRFQAFPEEAEAEFSGSGLNGQDEAFHRVAYERWAKIMATGKTVPWDDAKTWVEARSRGEHPRKPEARKQGS
ncbi:DUF2442 domain-containing protein [Acidisphaera sp. S103]|uniref:DUF2442 domain-containing protein n=1 Tax=Acidisphaera sp. S103 TaxID=1747223 RepID=UPI001C20B39A|nr:DUF2442 domain-containing protein [Acidisphaera sp. S103]